MGGAKWILACGLLLLVSSTVCAQDRAPAVAVHLLEGRGVDLSEKDLVELTDYAGVRFGEAAACQIIPWAQVHEKIRSKGYYMCMDRHCQMEAEQMLNADYTLALSVLPMGKACILTGSLYPRASPATLRTAMHKGTCSREELVGSLDEVVKILTSQGPLTLPKATRNPRPAETDSPPPPEAGPTQAENFEGGQEEEGDGEESQVVVVRPPMYLGIFAVYAPAPLLWYGPSGNHESEKMLDQYGPRVSLDMEVADVWLMGVQIDGLGNRDNWMVEVIGRAGGQFIFGDSLQVYGLLGVGASAWIESGWSDGYEGVVLNATLGARYMFMPSVGLQFELSGTASFFGEDEGFYENYDIDVFRLETALGMVVAF